MSEEYREGQVVDDRFRLDELLAQGGFGVVWRATLLATGETVALKLLLDRQRAKPWARSTFEKEADILMRLQHRNIARLVAFRLAAAPPYLALEYVSGHTLGDELYERARRQEPFSIESLLAVLDPLVDALSFAHALDIVHRDLKPKNVMLDADGRVKLLDFGIAKLLGTENSEATTVGRLLGSVLYLTPEQIRGRPSDARSDVFSLATLAFEMLSLRRAWSLESYARDRDGRETRADRYMLVMRGISHGPRPTLSSLRPEMPREVDAFFMRALAIEAADRPRDARTFLGELRAAFDERMPHELSDAAALTPPPETDRAEVPGELIGFEESPRSSRAIAWIGALTLSIGALLLGAAALYVARAHPSLNASDGARSTPEQRRLELDALIQKTERDPNALQGLGQTLRREIEATTEGERRSALLGCVDRATESADRAALLDCYARFSAAVP